MAQLEIGDRVRILDGTGHKDYAGGWVYSMKRFVGRTAIISDKHVMNPYGVRLVDEEKNVRLEYIWDSRYLQKLPPQADILPDGSTVAIARTFRVLSVGKRDYWCLS